MDKLRTEDGLTLSKLCNELEMSRQAVSKHLVILENANLVVALQRGRNKHRFLNPIPLHEIIDRWVGEFRQVQSRTLLELKHSLELKQERKQELEVKDE